MCLSIKFKPYLCNLVNFVLTKERHDISLSEMALSRKYIDQLVQQLLHQNQLINASSTYIEVLKLFKQSK